MELGTNFRSIGPLVDVTNALFARILGPERFSPAKSHRTVPDPAIPRAELMLVRLEGGEKGPKGELEAEALARRIADMVRNEERLVCETAAGADGTAATARPVRYGDIAVLLRTTTHVKEFEAALARHGIPYYVVGGTGFYGRPEVIWLVDLLRAIDDRSDVTSLAAVLRSPVFGLSDESLLRLKMAAGSLDRAVWDEEAGSEPAGTAGEPDAPGARGLIGAELARFRRARTCLRTLAAAAGRMPVGALVKAAIEIGGFEEHFAFVEQGAHPAARRRRANRLHIAEFASYSMPLVEFGCTRNGCYGGRPMTALRIIIKTLPIALATSLTTAALAQQPPAAPKLSLIHI